MRAYEILTEEPIKLRGFGPSEKSKEFVAKVYDMFPESPLSRDNRIMAWKNDTLINDINKADQLVQFELIPRSQNQVEIKWIQATPFREGAGSKAMKILQDLARENGIKLILFPWDKGVVSQAKLMKFYRKQGFKKIGSSKNMEWNPE